MILLLLFNSKVKYPFCVGNKHAYYIGLAYNKLKAILIEFVKMRENFA